MSPFFVGMETHTDKFADLRREIVNTILDQTRFKTTFLQISNVTPLLCCSIEVKPGQQHSFLTMEKVTKGEQENKFAYTQTNQQNLVLYHQIICLKILPINANTDCDMTRFSQKLESSEWNLRNKPGWNEKSNTSEKSQQQVT